MKTYCYMVRRGKYSRTFKLQDTSPVTALVQLVTEIILAKMDLDGIEIVAL
jgi:hypothetical protein